MIYFQSVTATILFCTLFFAACGDGSEETPARGGPSLSSGEYYVPKPGTSFSIVLDGEIPSSFEADVIDLDAFNTSAESIRQAHASGKKVMAYLSVGSWEPYRVDANTFPKEVIGKVYPGWEDEKFLNLKAVEILLPIMRKRFDMIQAKGFDGIEADNIDIYGEDSDGNNGTSFHISLKDTKRYVDLLLLEAHKRGLSIGQKNAPEFVRTYGDLFDWALLEDPFYEGYATSFKPYIEHEKAVFALSYTDNTSVDTFLQSVCAQASLLQFTSILKDRDLTRYEVTCPK